MSTTIGSNEIEIKKIRICDKDSNTFLNINININS